MTIATDDYKIIKVKEKLTLITTNKFINWCNINKPNVSFNNIKDISFI